MSINLINKIEKWGTIQFIFLFTVLSEIFTAFMNAALGIIFWGKISVDLLAIGSIDALVVSLVVSSIGIHLIRKNAELNSEIVASKRTEAALQQEATALEKTNKELQTALAKIKTLSEMLPICSYCKKIRDDKGYWEMVETYISKHTDTVFSHGTCPECAEKAAKEFEEFKKKSGR
jgi:hypothetical protein